MNPVRRKLVSSLTEAVHKEIKALSPESPYAKELHEIGDVDTIIAEEIEEICDAATLGEMAKAFLQAGQLKIVSVQKKDSIKNELSRIAKKLVERTEAKSGPLRLAKIYRHLFSKL